MTVYLDHAATSPLRPEAREAWLEAAARVGNPSSLHTSGRAARAVLEDARDRVADLLGAQSSEVLFTSGATEALNLAVKGLVWAAREAGKPDAILTGPVEHHAVLDACGWLGAGGAGGSSELRQLAVDADGSYVRTDATAGEGPAMGGASAWDGAAVAALQWVNNETGVIQPLHELATSGAERGVPVVGDVVQGIGHLPFDFGASPLAAAALSAHKVGGPVGIGALLLRRTVRPAPLLHGGGQERRIRSGTLDAPGAAAFAAALAVAVQTLEAEALRLEGLAARLAYAIKEAAPGATVHASGNHIVHAIIPGAPSEALLLALDRAGIDASPGAACTAGVIEPSHVVLAMGRSLADAGCTLRLSLGWSSTEADVDAAVAALPVAIAAALGGR